MNPSLTVLCRPGRGKTTVKGDGSHPERRGSGLVEQGETRGGLERHPEVGLGVQTRNDKEGEDPMFQNKSKS